MTTEPAIAPIGHNAAPLVLPVESEMLADLQRKYPEIAARITEWQDALATYPADLSLDRPDEAEALQDLLGQIAKETRTWAAHEKAEKGPLNKLVKVVTNFFTKAKDTVKDMVAPKKASHDDYLKKKAEKARREAEEEAERQREVERIAREAADKARREQEAAEAAAAEQRRIEQEARAAAERAAREKAEAEQRAAAAKEAERRQAEERKARERAEKEAIATNMRDIRELMREAEKLNTLADAEEASEEETGRLDALIRAGGMIGELARPVAASTLLDEDQQIRINAVRARLGELQDAQNARFGKREQKRRAAEAKAEQERLDREAADRQRQREEDDRLAAEARTKRLEEEAAAESAKAERKAQEDAARAARDAAREHEGSAKGAGKDAKAAASDADRSANRANRLETKLEKSTEADLSRTRGDLGTVASLGRRWQHAITDEDALRAAFRASITVAEYAMLADQLNGEALNGAVFRFMRLHQDGWRGRERVADVLAGVVFSYETEGNIR